MDIIISHQNLDFDGLASIVAAKKLHPSAIAAIAPTQSPDVKAFLDLYIDSFPLLPYKEIDWKIVRSILIVDASSSKRAGVDELINTNIHIQYLDHHQSSVKTGANITLLITKLQLAGMDISPMEATLFGLGLYSDTGCFSFPSTTPADLNVGAYLIEQGMDLNVVSSYMQQPVAKNPLFESLLSELKIDTFENQSIGIATCSHPTYVPGIASVVEELHSLYQLDATVACCQLGKHIYLIGRARSSTVDLKELTALFGGGGHPQAASALIKDQSLEQVYQQLVDAISAHMISDPPVSTIMSWPVQFVYDSESIEQVWKQSLKYGHSSFPVLNETQIMIGLISKADLVKAKQLGLENSPVKAAMKTNVVTLSVTDSIKTAHAKIATHHIGRLPVVDDNNQVIGIVTRTNLIQRTFQEPTTIAESTLKAYFTSSYQLLKSIGSLADELNCSVFLVGGVIRDLFLNKNHTDLDLIVEGDAIQFAHELADRFGGSVKSYNAFYSATWFNELGKEIDIVSCRKEYYASPGALPEVKKTSIYEDLARRDFSINAIAMFINHSRFGELVDLFNGRHDMEHKRIRILHPLSFVEDPTRIFRAVRFSLRLQFELDVDTRKATQAAGKALKQISAQRLLHELKKFENEDMLLTGFQKLDDLLVWQSLFQLQISTETTNLLLKLQDYRLKTSAHFLLALAYERKQFEGISRYFITKQDQHLLKEVQAIKLTQPDYTQSELHRELKRFSDESILFYALASSAQTDKVLVYLEKRAELKPLLAGTDLIELGYQPGPHFSEWLMEIECLQLEKCIHSQKDAVAWLKTHKKT